MAPTGGRLLYSTPPVIRRERSSLSSRISRALLGILFTTVFIALFILCSPIFVALRVIGYINRKSSRWKFQEGDCSHQWPLNGADQDVGVVVTASPLDLAKLNANATRNLVHQKIYRGQENTGDLAQEWNQQDRRLANEKDLMRLVNDPGSFHNKGTLVNVVHDFSVNDKPCSCILLSTKPHDTTVCVPRIACVLSKQNFFLEIEPMPLFHVLLPLKRSSTSQNVLVVTVWFLTEGPINMLSRALRSPHPIWKQLEGHEVTSHNNRRRLKGLRTEDSESILMESIPEDVVVVAKEGEPHLHRGDSLLKVAPPTSHRRCTVFVPSPDLVSRAEKLLRASTVEVMLAMLSGALRNHCRAQGFHHPPDLSCVMPYSSRSFLPISSRGICDTALIPLELPCSVEGSIPRIWSVQVRMNTLTTGPIPSSMKIAHILARQCLPSPCLTSFFRSIYSSYSIYVAFYKACGSVRIDSETPIQSMLYFPSLHPSVKAAFVFIQLDKQIQLCATLCKKAFPNPNLFLEMFEKQTSQLLEHLSIRLLSLPASTFLPQNLPSFSLGPRHNADARLEEMIDLEPEPTEEDQYSLEELYHLLATVQNELDGMRAKPQLQGGRAEYIRKLAALEDRMQRFHECIMNKIGNEAIETQLLQRERDQRDGEMGTAVSELLAPYKEESAEAKWERAVLRERTDSQSSRKGSHSSI